MDFLRLILLLMLLAYGAAATDHARTIIGVQQKEIGVAFQTVAHTDKFYIRHVAGLASVQPASIVVQDGILLGTGLDRTAELSDPTAHAETEAIRDACRRAKTLVLKDGVLYASRRPCRMCMGVIERSGISKVCYPSVTASRDSIIFIMDISKQIH